MIPLVKLGIALAGAYLLSQLVTAPLAEVAERVAGLAGEVGR